MKKFTTVACLLCICLTYSVNAAPTVRKLSGINSVVGVGNAGMVKENIPLNVSRTATVRSVQNVNPVGQTSHPSTSVNTNRLSIGKQLHDAGVEAGIIKSINSTSSISNTNLSDSKVIQNLTDRISALESQIKNVSVRDTAPSSGKVVKSITVTDDNVIELNKVNVQIPVGDEDSNTAAAVWIEQD